jgi:hypothetical protein
MDGVQFDVLRCTHRILETILNLRHCRATIKVSRLCDAIAVYVQHDSTNQIRVLSNRPKYLSGLFLQS